MTRIYLITISALALLCWNYNIGYGNIQTSNIMNSTQIHTDVSLPVSNDNSSNNIKEEIHMNYEPDTASARKVLDAVAKNDNVTVISEISNEPPKIKQEMLCLSLLTYHEARGSSKNDQLGVQMVVFNRLNDERWKDRKSICSIIFQTHYTKKIILTNGKEHIKKIKSIQFSWSDLPIKEIIPYENDAWIESQKMAVYAFKNKSKMHDVTNGSVFFYDSSVKRKFKNKTSKHHKPIKIGDHIFT